MNSRVLNKYLPLFASCFFLFGCGEPLMEFEINTKTPIVESYLLEGTNSLTVKVYSMEEYLNDEVKLSKPVSQLKVIVNQVELKEISSGVYHLDLGTDTIRENQKFDMQFNHNGKNITASTTVPAPIKSLSVTPQSLEFNYYDFYYGNDTTKVVVSWEDPDKSFYQIYIESPVDRDIPVLGTFRRRMMQPFKGNSYTSTARQFQTAGIYTISVFRVNKDFAELYERVSASDLANPVSYINNAFGIFTSMSVEKINVRVTEKTD